MPAPRSPRFRIRRARPADASTLLELQREFYVEDRMTHTPANARALHRLLRTPAAGAVWLISAAAEERAGGSIPVGYLVLTLGWSLELGGRDAFIDELYVRAERRGRGLGTLALATAEATARRLGVRALHLEVDVTNEVARRLYERIGYRLRERYQLMLKRL
jgi:ribosomal protein S18 acetylase RimI-like enzyme